MLQEYCTPRTPESVQPGEAPDEAIRLWQHQHGDRPDWLFLFSAFYRRKGDKGELVNPLEQCFAPDQLEAAAAWAAREDRNGREVYSCPAQLLAPRRLKENCAPSRVVHADMDGAPIEGLPIRPTAVVESSPGKHHAYFVLSRLQQPEQIEDFNRRLVPFGADKGSIDPVHLLRVPGTHHRKKAGVQADVKLLWIDEGRTIDPAELDRVLPKLPKPQITSSLLPTSVSGDDQELLTLLLERKPAFARAWQGDAAAVKTANSSDLEWMVARDLVEACGLDVDRAESLMRRCEALDRDKWDAPRGSTTYLRHTLEKAAKEPFQNATPYRSDDPSTWPELVAEIPDGPANGKCSDHCKLRHHPKEQALFRQVELINDLIQCDLSPIFKLTLLRLVALIGFHQSRGNTRFQASAKTIGESIKLSAQSVRPVLHALARHDFTRRDGQTLRNERGLIDLDSTRMPEAGPFCSVFDITPLTDGGYAGFLEAVVAFAPELPAPPKRAPRVKHEEVAPPPEVVLIPGCPGDPTLPHPMHSDIVVDATCGGEFIREMRYAQNVIAHRPERPRTLWSTSSDTPHRSGSRPLTADEIDRLNALYDRGRGAAS